MVYGRIFCESERRPVLQGCPFGHGSKKGAHPPKMRCSSFPIVASNFLTAARQRQAYYPVNRRACQAHDLLSRMRLAWANMSKETLASDLIPKTQRKEIMMLRVRPRSIQSGPALRGQMSVAECRSGHTYWSKFWVKGQAWLAGQTAPVKRPVRSPTDYVPSGVQSHLKGRNARMMGSVVL
jgi:hypothetical protein